MYAVIPVHTLFFSNKQYNIAGKSTALHVYWEGSYILSKGYSFAFQVLGYFTYEHNGNWKEAINAYKEYPFIYVYDKIWSELSGNDKRVIYGMAKSKKRKNKRNPGSSET